MDRVRKETWEKEGEEPLQTLADKLLLAAPDKDNDGGSSGPTPRRLRRPEWWDVARLLLLYLEGGVYADLDLEPLKSLDQVFASIPQSADLALAQEPKEHVKSWTGTGLGITRRVSNFWMAARRPRLQTLAGLAKSVNWGLNDPNRAGHVIHTTGSRVYSDWFAQHVAPRQSTRKKVYLLKPEAFSPVEMKLLHGVPRAPEGGNGGTRRMLPRDSEVQLEKLLKENRCFGLHWYISCWLMVPPYISSSSSSGSLSSSEAGTGDAEQERAPVRERDGGNYGSEETTSSVDSTNKTRRHRKRAWGRRSRTSSSAEL